MMKFLGFLFLVALAVGGYGYWKGWFEVSKDQANGKTKFGVTIDNDAMSRDLDTMTKWAHEKLDKLDQKIAELRNKASKASAESKQSLEKEIRALEAQKGSAAESLRELKTSTQEKAAELKKKLEQTLSDTPPVEKSGG